MTRKNPRTAAQPDLFGGQTPGYVPLEDVPQDELMQLRLSDFTDQEIAEVPEDVLLHIVERDHVTRDSPYVTVGEKGIVPPEKSWSVWSRFDDLPEGVQEQIRDQDKESQKRISALEDFFIQRWKWAVEPDQDELFRQTENELEHYLSEDDLLSRAQEMAGQRGGYDVDNLVESWVADGYSEEQVEAAVTGALQDQNNWKLEEGYEYSRAFFKLSSGEQSVYAEQSDIDEVLEGLYDDEVQTALEEVNRKTDLELADGGPGSQKESRIAVEGSRHQYHNIRYKYGIDIAVSSGNFVDADPDWNKIEDAVKETLEGEEPASAETAPVPVDEARVVLRYPDGAYVLDLVPEELPREGQMMGHCVGRPGMGYGRAVHQGQIKILSLRTEAGRSKFTIEAAVGRSASNRLGVASIKQVKGKANRLPGWDLGKVGVGPVKADEVEKVRDLVRTLKLDPRAVDDLRPGLDALESRPAKKNPAPRRAGACGVHGEGCAGFCSPYRP